VRRGECSMSNELLILKALREEHRRSIQATP